MFQSFMMKIKLFRHQIYAVYQLNCMKIFIENEYLTDDINFEKMTFKKILIHFTSID